MKKRIFKDWISHTLILVNITMFCLLSAEVDGTIGTAFMIKAPMACILIINHYLIARHTYFYEGRL